MNTTNQPLLAQSLNEKPVALAAPDNEGTCCADNVVEQPLDGVGVPKPLLFVEHPIYQEHGQGVVMGERRPKFNQTAIAHRFAEEATIAFDEKFQKCVQYTAETGLWRSRSDNEIKGQLTAFLRRVAEEYKLPGIAFETTPTLLAAIAGMVKFLRPATFTEVEEGLFKVGAGVLDLGHNPPKLLSDSPAFGFRNGCGVKYDPTAMCPQFENELLGSALDLDDVGLLQRYCGSILLGPNRTHRMMVLRGEAASGKSTFVTILESILGLESVAYLRTQHLAGRFEFSGFQGKRLLAGKDVPGDTLSRSGAKLLKSLVGEDALQSETKYVAEKEYLRGNFHVLLTCNSSLHIALDGDEDAWRRRLLVVQFKRTVETLRLNFAKKLLAEEGEGILAWMVKGAVLHLQERQSGGFVLTPQQQARVDDMIAQSESVMQFVRARIMKQKARHLTVHEITDAYLQFCAEKHWTPLSERQFQNNLAQAMEVQHHVIRRNDIVGPDKKSVRGFSGVALLQGTPK